jgi:hypothetical protein
MIRTFARFVVVAIGCVIVAARPDAQAPANPWFGLQPNLKTIDQPKVFTGAFQIALPKNWHMAPGHTGTIFSVVEDTKKWETGGLITLEYMQLQGPFETPLIAGLSDKELIATAGEVELKTVRDRELSGKQFSVSLVARNPRIVFFVQYDRPGISGTDDHVAQYSIPIGLVMYRLICIAPAASIEKYRPVFAHVAASFQPAKPGSGQ